MNSEAMKMLLEQKKNEPIDAFGLSKKKLNAEEESQVTPYDSFCLEDSLRVISTRNILNEIKVKFASRMDTRTGLYSVTVADIGTEYYAFATMLNRLSNPVYSQKVWRNVNLLEGIIKSIRTDYHQKISASISRHSFDEVMNQAENKRL